MDTPWTMFEALSKSWRVYVVPEGDGVCLTLSSTEPGDNYSVSYVGPLDRCVARAFAGARGDR
jgi:hypothetical protein